MRILVGLLVAAAFMVGGVTADLAQAAAPAQFKWKMQSSHPAGAPQIELLNRMANDIDKMSNGRLKIEILATGAIVKPFELIDAVADDFEFGPPGTCGKDGQGVPVGDGVPTLRVSSLTVGGTAA